MTSARWLDLTLAAAAATALALGCWLVPAARGLAAPDGRVLGPTCWFHEVTGVGCPTCGMTRSQVALLHGDLTGSLRWHPAGPLMALASVAAIVAVAYLCLRRRAPLWGRRGFGALLTGLAAACLIGGLARHLI